MSIKLAYSKKEAAAATGVSEYTIQRAINSGALRAKRSSVTDDDQPSGAYLIRQGDLNAWLEGLADA